MLSASRGFTFVEFTCACTLTLLLAAVSLPAWRHVSESSTRRGAIELLMATLDQARAEALASGETVYVGFDVENSTPDTNPAQGGHGLILFQEAIPDNSATKGFFPLHKWVFLPRPFRFWPRAGTILDDSCQLQIPGGNLPGLKDTVQLPVLAFSSTGHVLLPAGPLRILLGIDQGTDHAPALDEISVARYSGRVSYASLPLTAP